jgi:nicotinamide-nucleotide adenylyltransferase
MVETGGGSRMKTGLVIMRAQPLHFGHIRLIEEALDKCEHVFIVLGSTQEQGTDKNPFSFGDRKNMIKRYFTKSGEWPRITVHGLVDIFSLRWPSYVLENLEESYNPEITDLFGGSQYDCDWFKDFPKIRKHIVDRTAADYPFISATMLREMLTYRDPKWMNFIPECNWFAVAKKFGCEDMLE